MRRKARQNKLSIGAADAIEAIAARRPARCDAVLAFHALEVMCSFEESSRSGRAVELQSSCERPAALPLGLIPGRLA